MVHLWRTAFARCLTELRKSLELSQTEVKESISIDVSKYESLKCLPRVDTLVLLCDFFDIETSKFLQRVEEEYKRDKSPVFLMLP